MKKIFLLLSLVVIITANVRAEENVSADELSTLIYEGCASQAPKATALQPVLGNIEDIKRERAIRNCIKKRDYKNYLTKSFQR